MKSHMKNIGEVELAPSHPSVAQKSHSPQEIQEFPGGDAQAPCPSCGCTRINSVQMPDHCHFAALRCGDCDRFLRWQAQPKNIETRQKRQAAISQLLKSSQLSEWERGLLKGLKGKKLSPKQQEVLSRIENKVGGGI